MNFYLFFGEHPIALHCLLEHYFSLLNYIENFIRDLSCGCFSWTFYSDKMNSMSIIVRVPYHDT